MMAGILDGILNLGLMGTFLKKLLSPRWINLFSRQVLGVSQLGSDFFFRRPHSRLCLCGVRGQAVCAPILYLNAVKEPDLNNDNKLMMDMATSNLWLPSMRSFRYTSF